MSHSDVEVLMPPKRAASEKRKRGYLPILRTIAYTLDISTRFLARSMVGTGTVESADNLLDGYWKRIFRSANGELSVKGREHFEPGNSYVVMTNHSSLLDIPALMGAIPGSMRMVMKEELSRVPIWGPALVASGFIPIDRKNRQKAIAQLEKAKQQLASGISVWISPEGTRSRTGGTALSQFKKGGFHLAMDLGRPIIPGWIEGANGIIPPDQFVVVYDGHCTVRFGPPIQTANRKPEDMPKLMEEVRVAIEKLRVEAQA